MTKKKENETRKKVALVMSITLLLLGILTVLGSMILMVTTLNLFFFIGIGLGFLLGQMGIYIGDKTLIE